jgi:carotenoid cleavage dioxygenase-like enzyme
MPVGQFLLIKTEYIPIIHDFVVFKNKFIFLDAPFKWDWTQKIPAVFDRSKPSYIYLFDNQENILRKIPAKSHGFYIFHYAYIKDTDDTLEIYASQYDELEFSNINLKGNYRMIEINKKNKTVFVHKNDLLENHYL